MDMAVEIFVWLGIGVIIMGMMTAFLMNWDFTEDTGTLQQIYENDIPQEMNVDFIGFANALSEYWEFCNHTSGPDRVFYVYQNQETREGTLSKQALFEIYTELNFCKNIQSANQSCGRREDLNMTNISLPAVVRVQCENNTLFIR